MKWLRLNVKMAILNPKISADLPVSNDLILAEEAYFDGHHYKDSKADRSFCERVCFRQSIFTNCDFSGVDFASFECLDVVFNHCDLSNVVWLSGVFHRVEFNNCRMTGANFAESVLHNYVFNNALLNYSSFNFAKFKNVLFQESPMQDSEFTEVTYTNLQFQSCELTASNWAQTPMNQLDFSNSTFEHLTYSLERIKGLKVNPSQALTLATSLGIRIV
ncbi:pentapeptide repeat-containing protein [Pseudolactococcus reticulitermitis]|nr:pentapeptide repeat-containing protein [Lactococcus reticulitermitis]